jgi:WD40 repeat protein
MDDPTVTGATGPYKGLTHFTEADAAFFFGRESERDLIVASLKAARLTLVYGQSGAGKSSLLRAGVAASLREAARRDLHTFGTAEFVPVVFSTWRDDPLAGIAAAIEISVSEFVPPPGQASAPGAPLNGPPHDGPPHDGQRSLVELIEDAAARAQASLLLIFDQFEEYFLYHGSEKGPVSFSEQFPLAVGREGLPAGFLIATREDALAQLDHFRGRIPNLFGSYRRISPLGKDAARQAIRGPIDEYNRHLPPEEQVSIEAELVAAVVDQVATGKVKLESVGAGTLDGRGDDAVEAPYLQLVMTRIWQEEVALGSRRLRLSTLEALGGAQKIVRSHLDATLSALSTEDQDTAADVFHHLVTPSGTKIAHSVTDLVDYTSRPEDRVTGVLDRLGEGDTRIVRFVQPPMGADGPPRYEIFHDVLAPAVLDWRGRYAAHRLEAEKESAEQRARVQRRRALVAWGAAALAIALLAIFVVGNAEEQRDANRSRVLAADAVSNLGGDPELSTLLALSALGTSATPQAAEALRQSFPQVQEEKTLDFGSAVAATVFSPDGRQVAAGTADNGEVKIWDLSRPARPWVRATDFSYVNGLAFSPDGRYIAVVGEVQPSWRSSKWPGVEILADAATGKAMPLYVPGPSGDSKPLGEMVAWQGPVHGTDHLVTVDTNGYICEYHADQPFGGRCAQTGFSNLSSVSLDQTGTEAALTGGSGATVWSVPGFRQIFPTNGTVWGSGNVSDGVLSQNGRELATTSVEGITQVTDLYGDHTVVAQFSAGADLQTGAFSPDGTQLVTTTDLGQATVWQLEQASQLGGIEVAQLDCDCGVVYSAEFDPADPGTLVTGSEDGLVRVWDARPRELLFSAQVSQSLPWSSQTDGVGAVAFAPGLGDVVALTSGVSVAGQSAAPDKAVVIDLHNGRQTTFRYGSAPADMQSVTVAQPRVGATTVVGVVAVGSQDLVRGWQVTNDATGAPRARPVRLALPTRWPGAPQTVVASPDGSWLAVVFSDSDVVEVVDLARGRAFALPRTAGYSYFVNSVDFNASGSRVLVSYNDGLAWEWSITSGPERDSAKYLGAFRDPARDAVVWDAQFSLDGGRVVMADNAGNLTVFGTGNYKAETELNTGSGQVNTAVFSPDGSEVLTAGDDGTVRIWDVADRSQLAALGPFDAPFPTAVNVAVFGTFDGQTAVISASNDGFVRVLSAEAATGDLADLRRAAQARVTRGYNASERAEYLNG